MNKADDESRKTVVISDTVRISSQAKGIVRVGSDAVSYTESPVNGRAVHASLDVGGVNHGFTGATPKNEDGTLQTCTNLVLAMNAAGARWAGPVLLDQHDDADASCQPLDGGTEVLRIQVVRARVDSAFWKEAGRTGGGSIAGLLDALVSELRAPIEHKGRSLPAGQSSKLVLAINALDTPGYTLGSIPRDFRERHGKWAALWGFQQIWLVGPSPSLTTRLA